MTRVEHAIITSMISVVGVAIITALVIILFTPAAAGTIPTHAPCLPGANACNAQFLLEVTK